MRLQRPFYERNVVQVARDLLGRHLVHYHATYGRLSGIIVETEAYRQDDTACHAHRRKTKRNAVMFGPAGHAYIYFVYGMHHMLNIVAEADGYAAAVLIRAIEPLEGVAAMQQMRGSKGQPDKVAMLTNGPAKLTKALSIDKSLNEVDMVQHDALWVEQGTAIDDANVQSGARIGIHYAEDEDRLAPWRFWVRTNA